MCFCSSLVVLVCLEWLNFYGFIDTSIGRYIRAFLLCLFLLCLFDPGTWIRGNIFPLARPFIMFGFLIVVYALYKRNLEDELYYVIKILFWIVGTFFVYRMLLLKLILKKHLMRTINIITFIYFVMVPYSILNPSVKFSQNIGIYVLLWCVPFLMIQDKSRTRSFLIICACFAIFLSFKRGAMLALILSFVAYIFCTLMINRTARSAFKAFFVLIALFLVIVLSVSLVKKIRPDFFAHRVADLGSAEQIGSGRGTFYVVVLNHYLEAFNSNPLNFFFGFGSRSAHNIIGKYYGTTGIYAHSDWLELTHDYGLFGIFVLGWIHISILMMILKGYRKKLPYMPALLMAYVILFLMNICSGMFFFPNAIYFGTFMALISAFFQIQSEADAVPVAERKTAIVEGVSR